MIKCSCTGLWRNLWFLSRNKSSLRDPSLWFVFVPRRMMEYCLKWVWVDLGCVFTTCVCCLKNCIFLTMIYNLTEHERKSRHRRPVCVWFRIPAYLMSFIWLLWLCVCSLKSSFLYKIPLILHSLYLHMSRNFTKHHFFAPATIMPLWFKVTRHISQSCKWKAHINIIQYYNKLLLLNADSVKQFVFVLGCVMKCFI